MFSRDASSPGSSSRPTPGAGAGTGGLGDSPVVRALPRSNGGAGLTREELRLARDAEERKGAVHAEGDDPRRARSDEGNARLQQQQRHHSQAQERDVQGALASSPNVAVPPRTDVQDAESPSHARGGLASSPIVQALSSSSKGAGKSREELKYPLAGLRNATLSPSSLSSPGSYTASLSPAQSFHSTLTLTLDSTSISAILASYSPNSCAMTVLAHFPPSLILDPYQLESLSSDRLLGSSHSFYGEIELELPLSRVGPEGSALVVTLETGQRTLEIPVHARYLEPLSAQEEAGEWQGREALREVHVEWPWVGLVCEGEGRSPSAEGGILSAETNDLPSPFPPFSILFPPRTTLHALQPSVPPLSSSLLATPPHLSTASADWNPSPLTLRVPVGRLSHFAFVEPATTVLVWLAAGWVGWKVWRSQGGREAVRKEERKVD